MFPLPDLAMRHWIAGGALFWAIFGAGVGLGSFLGFRESPVARKVPRYECLCPDSIPESGPRSLQTEGL